LLEHDDEDDTTQEEEARKGKAIRNVNCMSDGVFGVGGFFV
jgi:hypothetical protein